MFDQGLVDFAALLLSRESKGLVAQKRGTKQFNCYITTGSKFSLCCTETKKKKNKEEHIYKVKAHVR